MERAAHWLAFGDIHGDISRFAAIPELEGAAGVIVTGDITVAGGAREALRVLEPIAGRVPRLLAQIGNMDRKEVAALLDDRDWNLHARARLLFPGVAVIGLGGSPPTPFGTPGEYSEGQLAAWLDEGLAGAAALPGAPLALVLAAHAPPLGTACDRLRSGGSAGSAAVRAFIEKERPELCLCGHIHEARAEERIGRTVIINPGPLALGGYVLLRPGGPEGRAISAELKTLP